MLGCPEHIQKVSVSHTRSCSLELHYKYRLGLVYVFSRIRKFGSYKSQFTPPLAVFFVVRVRFLCDAVGGGTRLQHPVATLMCQCLGCRERIEDGKYFALKASSSELHQTCRPVLVHMYEPNPQL